MIGRTIDHYEITAVLGQGGMGVVYRAYDQKLDRPVALKFLGEGAAEHRDARLRFVNEAKAASSLDHPNICTVHEIGDADDGQTYIVMPLYEGQSFRERARSSIAVDEAVDLVRQAALGLAKAHESGIVHRDVKSQNLIVTNDGIVKVLDFGLAKLADRTQMTRTGATLGTLQYMSPEQARGEELDGRTDVYSLGVVLYELLTGELPFAEDNPAATLHSILSAEPGPPSARSATVPAAIDAVVLRAMQKDPRKRYADLREMIADLDRFSGNAAMGTRVRPPAQRGRIPARWWVIALILLLGAGGLFLRLRATDRVGGLEPPPSGGAIGVMYIDNLSADPALDWMEQGIVELLNTALSRSEDLSVVDSHRLAATVAEMGGDPSRGIDQSVAAEVARRAGIGSMLVGSIVKTGNTLRLQLRRIDVQTGEILHSDHVDGSSDADIFAMVAALTERMQNHLEISALAETVDEDWIREISASSVVAYRAYIQGRSYFVQNEHERARSYFERAIAADPDFVMAYVDLIGSCFNLEDFDCIAAAHAEALRLRPTASRKEQLYIDVTGAVIQDESDLQITLATELLQLDPQALFWRYILGRGHYMKGQYERALREWEPLIARGYNWVWTYAYASDAALEIGDPAEAVRILDRGFEITPAENHSARARLHRYRGRALTELGRYREARLDLDNCTRLEPGYQTTVHYDLGRLYEAQGESEEAIANYEAHLRGDANPEMMEDARRRLKSLKNASPDRR